MKWFIIFLSLLISSLAIAETRFYLVYRSFNFPQDRFKWNGTWYYFNDLGVKVYKQPSVQTQYMVSWDGTYSLWRISPTAIEQEKIDYLVSRNYGKLLASWNIGDGDIETLYDDLRSMPTDYFKPPVVIVTTGTVKGKTQ